MRVSIEWLRSLFDPGWDVPELCQRLTMAGLEVEAVEPASPEFSGVVVGEVLAVERHPAADRLTVCQVAGGGAGPLQVVCGAPNVHPGMKTPFALDGALLPGGLAIRRTKLRGVESAGMLCSARELGLAEDHEGILELPADCATGGDLRAALALDDTVITLNVTPNRGDVLSMIGVAREVAALAGERFALPALEPLAAVHRERVEVRL
ncbi:MAG: phenylalanine--tRNA ligase subunit beta, partial [Gammaproteobacteria bacterium]|nr:phenylalanine--tRNA ligase subunit beta [Gammaproteobacteria bacterium]